LEYIAYKQANPLATEVIFVGKNTLRSSFEYNTTRTTSSIHFIREES